MNSTIHRTTSCGLESRYELGEACAATRSLFSTGKHPTAIICINDVVAHGAILACQSIGFDVPDDVSVTGFDDLEFAAHVHPAITIIYVPAEQRGTEATRRIITQLSG